MLFTYSPVFTIIHVFTIGHHYYSPLFISIHLLTIIHQGSTPGRASPGTAGRPGGRAAGRRGSQAARGARAARAARVARATGAAGVVRGRPDGRAAVLVALRSRWPHAPLGKLFF